MPRPLESEQQTLEGMPPLSKDIVVSPEPIEPIELSAEPLSPVDSDSGDRLMSDMNKANRRRRLHTYTRPLTLTYLESCLALEMAAFPPEEAADREKFVYRLTNCPELGLGIFTSVDVEKLPADSVIRQLPTFTHAVTVDSAQPSRREVLLGHAVGTMMATPTVSDESMAVPSDWRTSAKPDPKQGHQPTGRNIALHSLAVVSQCRGIGLASILLKEYIQRMGFACMGDRIALLAHDILIPFYEKFGFTNIGQAQLNFSGCWYDMAIELPAMLSNGEGHNGNSHNGNGNNSAGNRSRRAQ